MKCTTLASWKHEESPASVCVCVCDILTLDGREKGEPRRTDDHVRRSSYIHERRRRERSQRLVRLVGYKLFMTQTREEEERDIVEETMRRMNSASGVKRTTLRGEMRIKREGYIFGSNLAFLS